MNAEAPFPYRLYLVTDERACLGRPVADVAEAAVKGGVDIVQIRQKNDTHKDFVEKALQLKEMLDRYSIPLIVNDSLPVAMECNAAGIHVGKADVSPAIIRKKWPGKNFIGYSIEYEAQVSSEEAALSDYLGISPVFSTPTKTDTVTVWGLDGVRAIRAATSRPLVAIGGIDASNAFDIIKAGANCLAVISAICSADDPAKAAEMIRNEIEKALNTR
jgi:thiamine-phosphate pyrophosphorylase